MPLIKICGVMDPETAFFAAQAGADFIGIMQYCGSKRYVSKERALEIAAAARRGGAKPVAVYVDAGAEEIVNGCSEIVQLHGGDKELPPHFIKFHVNAKDAAMRPSDYLIFDNEKGGSGLPFNWETFEPPVGKPWFLAGGLNVQNIREALEKFQPIGVDVSTGVEVDGVKDRALILEFIKKAKYGRFGGAFIPELLVAPLQDLERHWKAKQNCPEFRKKLDDILQHYAGRPTPLTEVARFAAAIGGPRIFLKREDLLHTGAHKLNNALGQCLLAKEMGKTRIIAETGAGQHGVATATACAYLGLECVVYMGKVDIERQAPNVAKIKLLGAEVRSVEQGSATLKDAVNEALRDWSASYETSHYCLGSALGPHPFPEMVAAFQSVIGKEVQAEIAKPDVIIACVGGGSNAIGIFSAFIDDPRITLIGVEAGGDGQKHAARFKDGKPGVLHGCYTYMLQDKHGQVSETHSISAGLDYPAIGPKHADLYESGRAQYTYATDDQALKAFKLLAQTEGIIPALESSHALGYLMQVAKDFDKDAIVIVNLSGRGDKDLPQLFSKGLI